MSRKLLFLGLVPGAALVVLVSSQFFHTSAHASTVKIQFVNYVQSGLPEQDVFVEPDNVSDNLPPGFAARQKPCKSDADMDPNFVRPWMLPPPISDPCDTRPDVVRPEPQDARRPTLLAKLLFATRNVMPHDPFKSGANPLGPFPKGAALGLTWRAWLAASGHGSYDIKNDHAELNLSFQNLIPHASYSLWCGQETARPNDPSFEAPCGRADGTQNQFTADAQGNASISIKLSPLPPSTKNAATILSLSYDRIMLTPDGELGGYGLSNHVQLFFKFPPQSLPSE